MDTEVRNRVARKRERECLIEGLAYQERLALLSRVNWITVVVPSILSAFGAAAVAGGDVAGKAAGGAALLSAVLVAVHKGRNCDAYQTEARRLKRDFDELGTRFRTLHETGIGSLETLENDLAKLRGSAEADVSNDLRREIATRLDSELGAVT